MLLAGLSPATIQALAQMYSGALRADDEREMYAVVARWLPEVVPTDQACIAMVAATRSADRAPSTNRGGDTVGPNRDGEPHLDVVGLGAGSESAPWPDRIAVGTSGPGLAMTSGATQVWTANNRPDRVESGALLDAGFDAVINAPITVEGLAEGAISVTRVRRAGPYTNEHGQLMTDVASVISLNLERFVALGRARDQLDASERNLRRWKTVGRLGRRLSAAMTEEDARTAVTELTSGVLPVDEVRIITERTEELVPVADRSPVPIADLSASSHPEHRRLAEAGYASGVTVPVVASGGVVAVLTCASVTAGAYSSEDLVAVETIATVFGETLDRIRAQEALAAGDRELAAIVDHSPLLMMTIDSGGEVLQLSEFGASQLGYEADRIRGVELRTLYPADQRDTVDRHMAQLSSGSAGTIVTWDADMTDADGHRLRVRHTARRLRSEASRAAAILVCEDVTELQEMADRLEHEATHDPLTGLVNRREFDRRLTEAIESGRTGGPIGSVCFIDVDQFKNVNDTGGHRAGDALLIELADTLQSALSTDDVVGRIGGDEFAVLLPGCAPAAAVRVAERLRSAAANLVFAWGGRTFSTSISIGVAAIRPDTSRAEEVMGRADAACYDAKNTGRNRVSVASSGHRPQRSAPSIPDAEWDRRIRDALEQDDLRLVSQSIAATGPSGDRRRAEMLVRIEENEGEWLPAGLFIPAAERLDIVTRIDSWVVRRVVSLLCEDPQSRDLDFLAVNLSPQSIQSESFLDDVVELLSTSGLDPSKLLFEISETTALSQFAQAMQFIETASAVGCRFALDDFGSSFSTFQYLKHLPVDMLKIDGELIRAVGTSSTDLSIVKSIVEVAGTLGMRTIAEFVEDEETLARVTDLGIDFAQGYGVARPTRVLHRGDAEPDDETPAPPRPPDTT